jgi:hypothetical protein
VNAGNYIVLFASSFVLVVSIGVAIYDTWDRHKIAKAVRQDALRLAALRAQFDQDHPNRTRLGIRQEED